MSSFPRLLLTSFVLFVFIVLSIPYALLATFFEEEVPSRVGNVLGRIWSKVGDFLLSYNSFLLWLLNWPGNRRDYKAMLQQQPWTALSIDYRVRDGDRITVKTASIVDTPRLSRLQSADGEPSQGAHWGDFPRNTKRGELLLGDGTTWLFAFHGSDLTMLSLHEPYVRGRYHLVHLTPSFGNELTKQIEAVEGSPIELN